ncbi:hypothetical protein NHX12_006037 [Muraenolepis orangiensis]|uniref:Uncharacterized protein n=1 Tax=Muraenolepis orangiensis TaxID=630683 RepID=A0A9Q0DUA3_9TELE|nr:hypothetical protein NHX12_006037 [Muraenolepis orangiensis]
MCVVEPGEKRGKGIYGPDNAAIDRRGAACACSEAPEEEGIHSKDGGPTTTTVRHRAGRRAGDQTAVQYEAYMALANLPSISCNPWGRVDKWSGKKRRQVKRRDKRREEGRREEERRVDKRGGRGFRLAAIRIRFGKKEKALLSIAEDMQVHEEASIRRAPLPERSGGPHLYDEAEITVQFVQAHMEMWPEDALSLPFSCLHQVCGSASSMTPHGARPRRPPWIQALASGCGNSSSAAGLSSRRNGRVENPC